MISNPTPLILKNAAPDTGVVATTRGVGVVEETASD